MSFNVDMEFIKIFSILHHCAHSSGVGDTDFVSLVAKKKRRKAVATSRLLLAYNFQL